MKKIRVLLIEDYSRIESTIKKMLKLDNSYELLSEPNSSKIKNINNEHIVPDVILVDYNLKYQECLSIVESSKKEYPTSRVILVNLPPQKIDILLYIQSGVEGFSLNDTDTPEFLNAVRQSADGLSILPSPLVNILFSQIYNDSEETKSNMNLIVLMTKREKEVMKLLCEGLKNKEIGQKICLSTFTVKSHIHNIMEKLGLHTRLEIANYSYANENLRSISKSNSMVIN